MMAEQPESTQLYDRDFAAWAQTQAALLRAGRYAELDLGHLAEEVEELGLSDWKEAQSYLALVIEHLLKLHYSAAEWPRADWRQSVVRHRANLEDCLETRSSLRDRLDLSAAYHRALKLARASLNDFEGAEAAGALQATCSYGMAQITATGWFPAKRHGLE